jgi:hypothetical protein
MPRPGSTATARQHLGRELAHAPTISKSCWTSARAWVVTGEGEAKRPWDAAVAQVLCEAHQAGGHGWAEGLAVLPQKVLQQYHGGTLKGAGRDDCVWDARAQLTPASHAKQALK